MPSEPRVGFARRLSIADPVRFGTEAMADTFVEQQETIMSHFQPLGVKRIDHITIVARDPDKSVEFYVGLLGMKHIGRPDFGFPGHWFQAGSTQIHLNQQSAEAGSAGMPTSTATEIARAFHYAFVVDDCDATAEQLRQQGVQIVEGPRTRPDGARQLYLRDPDQHLVELFSVPQQIESGQES